MEIIGLIFVALGVLVSAIGVLGIVRFKDVFNRLHSSGLITTLGMGLLLLGGVFIMPEAAPKLILLGVFLFITSPVATHAIAQAAYRTGR